MSYQHFQSLNLYNSALQKNDWEVSFKSKFVVQMSEEHRVDQLGQDFEEAKNVGGIVSDSPAHLTMWFSTKLPKSKFPLHTLFRCFTAVIMSPNRCLSLCF